MSLTFKLGEEVVSTLRNVLLSRDFIEHDNNDSSSSSSKSSASTAAPTTTAPPNFQWKTSRYTDAEAEAVERSMSGVRKDAPVNKRERRTDNATSTAPLQQRSIHKINHFQKMSVIAQKDELARTLRRLTRTYGNIFAFTPRTWLLPREKEQMQQEMRQRCADTDSNSNDRASAATDAPSSSSSSSSSSSGSGSSNSNRMWILKPSLSSQGKSIRLLAHAHELDSITAEPAVGQEYVHNPHLIKGRKYDLRIYVLILSIAPLRVYLYRRGLVRFSSAAYTADNSIESRTDVFRHLTNASVNKHNKNAAVVDDTAAVHSDDAADASTDDFSIPSSHKWCLSDWFRYLSLLCHVDPTHVWNRIVSLVRLTALATVGSVRTSTCAFELLGLDVMLDSTLTPILIECNSSPNIAISSTEDEQTKIPLLNDLITAVGFPLINTVSEDATATLIQCTNTQAPSRSESQRIVSERAQSSSTTSDTTTTTVATHTQSDACESSSPPSSAFSRSSLIGDFELVFPFNSATATANDVLAATVAGAAGTTIAAEKLQTFMRCCLKEVKPVRRPYASVAHTDGDGTPPSLPLTIRSLKLQPSPWTTTALTDAVNRAKAAARAERQRRALQLKATATGAKVAPERNMLRSKAKKSVVAATKLRSAVHAAPVN